MKSQKPADGILLDKNFGSEIIYKINCLCGSPDCTHTVWIEADDDGVQVKTYTRQSTDSWQKILEPTSDIENNWLWTVRYKVCEFINDIYNRVRLSYQIWSKGYVDFHAEIMMSKQQALNYSAALKQAISKTQRFQRKKALDKAAG